MVEPQIGTGRATATESDRLDTLIASGGAVAVVGMAGRFPGASGVGALWENLRAGVESIRPFSREELEAAGVSPPTLDDPSYVRATAPLDDMEGFDAGFFGFSPRDASILDPQHRHFLEVSWAALEDSGHIPERFPGAIGVFAGSGANVYLWANLMTNPELARDVGFFLLRHTGNDKDFLSPEVSYAFDLKGPSINVQTACSTSLVAVHMAMQSLLTGESDMALAGASTILQPHRVGYVHRPGEIGSIDGHCRAFDATSSGGVFGRGVGVVLLRRLEDAVRDGDTIRAVLLGLAVNNDGSRKVSLVAPSVSGQALAVEEALHISGVEPASLQYVEAHGSGTTMGDPIEVAALTQAFRSGTAEKAFCGLGSIKSSIGHLDTAAGVAGLIKVVQALRNRILPPTLHFSEPSSRLELEGSLFFVNAELRPWDTEGPRRAGVNSLGVGGTNAFAVVEEAPRAGKPSLAIGWAPPPLRSVEAGGGGCLRPAHPASGGGGSGSPGRRGLHPGGRATGVPVPERRWLPPRRTRPFRPFARAIAPGSSRGRHPTPPPTFPFSSLAAGRSSPAWGPTSTGKRRCTDRWWISVSKGSPRRWPSDSQN